VQLLFAALFGGCYWGYCRHVFPLLPLPGVPAWHKFTGSAAAVLCLLLYAAACYADPGIITPVNAAAHAALYPTDGVLYRSKQCGTCRLPRPARSKHCRVCGRCVARMDHHCIWLNTCVGLLNMRWFLAFLLAAALLCAYGMRGGAG
jgi:palmitoyltransferase